MTTPVQTKAEPVLADAADRRFTLPWVKAMALRYSMFLVMLVVIAYFSYRSARFSTVDNLQTILIAAAPFALIALGQTLVILTGGIDLSVGSVIAVAGMTGATLAKAYPGQLFIPIVGAILVGLLAGSINGVLIAWLNVPPFIATLGMLTAGRGIAFVIGDGAPINGLPQDFGSFANAEVIGLKVPVILMIVGIVVLAVVMRRTSYGMRVYAVGGNRTAAEIAGVNTRRLLFSVYAISGVLAGLSGVMLSSRVISGAPNLGVGLRARRDRRRRHRRRQPDGRPRHHHRHRSGPAADPDPEQRPRHSDRARLLAAGHQGCPDRRRRRGRHVVQQPKIHLTGPHR